MPHLKKWFPCGGFGSDDVDSVVHWEGETEEANPVAMPHTARASLEMAIEVGEIPIFQRKNKWQFLPRLSHRHEDQTSVWGQREKVWEMEAVPGWKRNFVTHTIRIQTSA